MPENKHNIDADLNSDFNEVPDGLASDNAASGNATSDNRASDKRASDNDDTSQYESLITTSKIMLVDDEPINTDVLQTYLESEGYHNFVTTSESIHAIELMRQEKPDVILLDLMMPDVSGFDIMVAMKRDSALQHIPVVILTSSDDAETKLKALQLGAMDFLAKPVDASELALRLRNTLAAKAYQHQLLNYDQLTGLAKFDAFLQTTIEATKTIRENDSICAILHVHMENLKTINVSLGREHGNRILQAFAHKLDGCVRSTDNITAAYGARLNTHIARTSGDKFAVFMGPLATHQQAAMLARRIIIDTGESHRIEGQSIYTSAKVGIAIFPDDTNDPQTLFSNAETAMLHARSQNSREGYAFYSQEMNGESSRLLAIENGLREAINKNELRVTYQPKVNVLTGKIIGAEALLRWMTPSLGSVRPDEFIPVAERSGLIIPIGAWILREACIQAQQWREEFDIDFKLAVNMSIKQIHNSDMVATVKKTLAESCLPASCLTLELTENMVMENAESNIDILHNLKEQGISLSIDDFGTGYSSLSYLQKFPLDELKIDKSFIEVLETPNSEAPVVKAMVSLAHDLGMRVVAEGIETDIQLHHVKQLSCELYQGYLCSKPVIADAFSELLRADNMQNAA